MRSRRLVAMLATAALPFIATANVWVVSHRTNPGATNFAPNGTLLVEYSSGASPKKLRELYLGGQHYDAVSVKPDATEVIGRYRKENGGFQWCVYNFERMQKEQKVTHLNAGPGYEVVDARYVDGLPTIMTHQGADFRVDQMAADGKWRKLWSNANGDFSGLSTYPRAGAGAYAMGLVGKMPFVDMVRATPKTDWAWWDFFGGRGASELGGFDPKAGIVAVRSKWKGDDVEIARSTPQGPLAPIQLVKPGNIVQITVIDGLTYVAIPGDKILVHDRSGKLVATLNGTLVAVD